MATKPTKKSPEGFTPAPEYKPSEVLQITVTQVVFETIAEAEAAKVIGVFLLKVGPHEYALASGNVINTRWDWQYVERYSDKWPDIYRPTDVHAGDLPALPAKRIPPLPPVALDDLHFLDAIMGLGTAGLLSAEDLGIAQQEDPWLPTTELSIMQ